MPRRLLILAGLAASLVASNPNAEDPVLKARAQRAAAQGIPEGDLPPVPRSLVEPPPLPPPEAHVKDTRRSRRARSKAKRRKGAAKSAPATKRAPRRTSKAKPR